MIIIGLALSWMAQDDEPKFADSLILSMSREKWAEYHAEKVGYSTMDMSNAQVLWGEALERRNDGRLAKAPSKIRKAIPGLRKNLGEYREEMVTLGSCFSGGGTMWNPVYAARTADVEETISLILTGGKAKKSYVVSTVTKKHAALGKAIELSKSDLEVGKFYDLNGYQAAKQALKKAGSYFEKIVGSAKTQPRPVSDLLLEFCSDAAEIPDEVTGEG